MRAKFSIGTSGGFVTFHREEGDRRYHGAAHAKGEHNLFYAVKQWLIARGFDVIKKRAQKDGHMLGDEFQPYVRCRKPTSDTPHIAIYSGFYALRGANEDWNAGEVRLNVEGGHFQNPDDSPRQPDWWFRIFKLAEQHPDLECELCGDAKHTFDGPSSALCAWLDFCGGVTGDEAMTLQRANEILVEQFQGNQTGLAEIIGTETTGMSLQSELRAFRGVYGDDTHAEWLTEQAGGLVAREYADYACPDCADDIPTFATEGAECANCGHVFGRCQAVADGTS
jgi:hypothetical protein